MNKVILLIGSAFFVVFNLAGQQGGRSTFRFLHMPISARINALGGLNVSHSHWDAAAAAQNPALLDKKMHSQIHFNHQFYFANTQHGFFGYAHHLEKSGINLHTGFQYMNFGEMRGFDEFEFETNSFRAADYAWYLGASKPVYDRLQIGMNLKIINSAIETFSSWALGLDIGALYQIPEKDIQIGFSLVNAGFILRRFHPETPQRMPYDVRLGLSKRLSKAPIQFSVTAHHLHRWNLLYENPERDNDNIFQPVERNTRWDWLENFFRHIQFGAEIYIGKSENFILRAGYNHFRRRDLTVLRFRSMAGISGGFGFKMKKFRIDYGFGTYHLAGSSHHFTLSTQLSHFTKNVVIE